MSRTSLRGSTPVLADAVLTTRLAEHFDDDDRWRIALAWLVRCGDSVDLAQVAPLVTGVFFECESSYCF